MRNKVIVTNIRTADEVKIISTNTIGLEVSLRVDEELLSKVCELLTT